ncbi:AAA family ATPase [Hansschlegelia zhihuaiae]|uniref:ATP-binding protein n=1 Tax=Hansschlegelia zhihuaiae TaxID=405005 RepID=A0A4Q0MJP4_9HYPH|nr:AAA family ATPase [Hansschlegelia zhihuaiae]RXF73778.1 ATP-binding protein [Hansschlegelia zhihuaiae]
MITRLCVSGYRSLRDVRLTLGRLNVVTGPNGSGKSSLYRALRLLADVAQGRIIQSLATEGGIQSTLWAGPESFSRGMKRGETDITGVVRSGSISLKLGFAGEDYGYAIDLGFPPQKPPSLFNLDPHIKAEALWTGEFLGRSNAFALRNGPGVRIRDGSGGWGQAMTSLASFDSMMTHCADPKDAVELLVLRERMRQWRFYDHLRADRDAPARRPQVGTYTPVLDGEGADLAAAFGTIQEIGDAEGLAAAVNDAFPGSRVEIVSNGGWFDLEMRQHGLLRPLKTAELSEGTLRYLLLIAALMSPRPPALMILNEPETSLHPDLLAALARLIALASERSQIVVISHALPLVEGLGASGARRIELRKELGETLADDGDDPPRWSWPAR